MARTSSKIVKTIPNSEIEKGTCFTKSNSLGDKYLITQNPLIYKSQVYGKYID